MYRVYTMHGDLVDLQQSLNPHLSSAGAATGADAQV